MKNNHILTAVKALKKQREKFEIEVEKATFYEEQAKKNKAFFEGEIKRLDVQIASLEGVTA